MKNYVDFVITLPTGDVFKYVVHFKLEDYIKKALESGDRRVEIFKAELYMDNAENMLKKFNIGM